MSVEMLPLSPHGDLQDVSPPGAAPRGGPGGPRGFGISSSSLTLLSPGPERWDSEGGIHLAICRGGMSGLQPQSKGTGSCCGGGHGSDKPRQRGKDMSSLIFQLFLKGRGSCWAVGLATGASTPRRRPEPVRDSAGEAASTRLPPCQLQGPHESSASAPRGPAAPGGTGRARVPKHPAPRVLRA